MTPAENDKVFAKDAKNTQDLNTFFLHTVKNLKSPECEEVNPFAEKLSHPSLKAIFKYNKQRSIITINVTEGCKC